MIHEMSMNKIDVNYYYDSSPYREIVNLSEKDIECGCGSGLEQGGRNLRWSNLQTISRHASLIPKPTNILVRGYTSKSNIHVTDQV